MDYVSLPNRTSHLGVVTSSRKVWQKRTPRASGSGKHVGEYKPTHVGSSFTVLYLSRTLSFFAFRPAPQPPAVQGKPESLPNLVQATCGKPASSRRLRSCDVQNSSSPASRAEAAVSTTPGANGSVGGATGVPYASEMESPSSQLFSRCRRHTPMSLEHPRGPNLNH